MKHDVDRKKIIRKCLIDCGLFVVALLMMTFGAVLLLYRELGVKQCLNPKIKNWNIENLVDHAYSIESEGDGYVTMDGDPYFILDVEYGQMVDIVLSGLPDEGSYGEFYSAAAEEDFSPQGVQYVTYRNGHNLVMLPFDRCDKIRVDIAGAGGVHFQVEGIKSGSPWILYLQSHWVQLTLLALLIVLFWRLPNDEREKE